MSPPGQAGSQTRSQWRNVHWSFIDTLMVRRYRCRNLSVDGIPPEECHGLSRKMSKSLSHWDAGKTPCTSRRLEFFVDSTDRCFVLLVTAPDCGDSGVDQWVERRTRGPKTGGSNPACVRSTRYICGSFSESKK